MVPVRAITVAFDSILEAVGRAEGISENTRNLLYGFIDGHRKNLTRIPRDTRDMQLRDAIYRAGRIARNANLNWNQRRALILQTLEPHVK